MEFIGALHQRTELKSLCRAFLEIGAAFKLEVTAIGVETPAHLDILRQMGCRSAQGYLLGRPMPAAEFIAWASQLFAVADTTTGTP